MGPGPAGVPTAEGVAGAPATEPPVDPVADVLTDADTRSGSASDGPAEVAGADAAAADEGSEPTEFDVFLSDMCATPVSPHEAELALRDATITELKRNLAALRPLGDKLAEAEKARLALEAQLAEVREELADALGAPDATAESSASEIDALRSGSEALLAERDKAQRGRERAETRLAKLREKFKKRDRVATERWHQIRALQQERRELRDSLKQAERSGGKSDAVGDSPIDLAGSRPPAPAPDLARLFDPNPLQRNTLYAQLNWKEI